MQSAFSSTLFLTILLAIGLGFFLRAASKDRTTVVDVQSPLPPLEVLNGISLWLEERGLKKMEEMLKKNCWYSMGVLLLVLFWRFFYLV